MFCGVFVGSAMPSMMAEYLIRCLFRTWDGLDLPFYCAGAQGY